jgi:hypothetical protein
MTVRHYTAGSGLTKRERVEIANPLRPEDVEEAASALRASVCHDPVQDAVRWAEATLAAEPKPDLDARRGRPGYEQVKQVLERFPQARLADPADAWRTPAWYAAQILGLARLVRAAKAAGDVEAVSIAACRLGALAGEVALIAADAPRLDAIARARAAAKEAADLEWQPWQAEFLALVAQAVPKARARRIIGGRIIEETGREVWRF